MDEKSNSRVRTALEVARILNRMRQLEADVEESDGVDGNGAIPAKLVISLLVQGKRSDKCRDLHESPVTTVNIASTRPWTIFTPSNAHHPTTGRQLTRRDVGLDVLLRHQFDTAEKECVDGILAMAGTERDARADGVAPKMGTTTSPRSR